MLKKFSIIFLFMLTVLGYTKVSAETYENALRHSNASNTSTEFYKFSSTAMNNISSFTVDGYTFIKPVVVRVADSNSYYWRYRFICKPATNCIQLVAKNGTITYSNNILNDSIEKNAIIEFYYIPVFDNLNDASLYSRGENYNQSAIVGGTVPIDYLIGTTERDNRILAFEPNMYATKDNFVDTTWNKGEYFIEIQQAYDLPENTNNHIMLNFNISIPTTGALNNYWNDYFGSATDLNDQTTRIIINNVKNKDVNAVYNSDGTKKSQETYTTFDITYDLNYCIDEGICTVSYKQEVDSAGTICDYILTDRTFDSGYQMNSITYVPKGITGMMIAYYNSLSKALFATNYININYISCWSYDDVGYIVYNPVNFYYPDQVGSGGAIFERRRFSNKTTITDTDIRKPTENPTDNTVGDDDTPQVKVPDSTVDSLFNTSIQDSYNNITNNYYYDNGLTQNILDYYRGFSDGATDENIDSALGYVKGTLGSLTHIPLLLSYCFNAFFPIEIIRLFQALLIIFVVFMIIRIIKHLFTH